MSASGSFHVASDIGGTFTDTVVIDESGTVGRFKAPTVPSNPVEGVVATLRAAAEGRQLSLEAFVAQIAFFAHGTTVATNAMIENERARVGLLQTRGFGDTLSIMRGFKSLGLREDEIKRFRTLTKQEVLLPKWLIEEVTERVDYAGRVVVALDEEDTRAAVRRLAAAGAEAFAVSFLWSFKNDAHEKRVGEIIDEEVPGALVTLSSELLPRIGEYQRTATTVVNASLRPVLEASLAQFDRTLRDLGLRTEPLLMQSNGGLATFEEIGRRAAATVMSGPVGGVIASQYLASGEEDANVVTTDMGGTSFDVGLVLHGRPVMSNTTLVGRDELALSSVAVRTVGAGSGSIAQVRDGLLTVGPASAGAVPGPACYGRGGTLPTVADADLVLGYLNPDHFLGGRLKLHTELAREAIRVHVAEPLGLSVEAAAEGIKTVIDARMADLIRQMTVEQGYDPNDFVLYAYGGAGPMHAFSYGADLRTRKIVVPLTASVHSAFGIASSDMTIVEELSRPVQSPPGSTDYSASIRPELLGEAFGILSERAVTKLADAGADVGLVTEARSVEMRFRSQIHVLNVPMPSRDVEADDVDALVERFIDQYEARFGKGSALAETGVEITSFRLVATSPVPRHALRPARETGSGGRLEPKGRREIFCGGSWSKAEIYLADELFAGASIAGLAVVEASDTTIVVGQNQRATVDALGSLVIESDV